MKLITTYDVRDFAWNKKLNAFAADAWELIPMNEAGNPFPNGKNEFKILNTKTNGNRIFKFKEEAKKDQEYLDGDGDIIKWTDVCWEFESEDGIKCFINLTA